MTFDVAADDPRVLDLFGLSTLPDGGERWLDIAAHPPELPVAAPAFPAPLPASV